MRKRFKALLLVIFLVTASPLPALAFFDTQGHWAAINIDHLAARGIVHGKSNEIFAPNQAVTRAEFATLLTNGLDQGDETRSLQEGGSSFSDIDSGFWAKGSLELCYELGIMVPDSRGRCYPHRIITRGETAVMVTQALGLPTGEAAAFADQDRIPAWAADAVTAVCNAGIMNGFPDRAFRSQFNLTRAQAAVIVENIMEYRGERYQGTGRLTDLDLTARKASLSIDGQAYTFDLADNFALQPLARTGYLKLPFPCNFDLNKEGDLAYCLQIDPGGVRSAFFATRKAPVSPGSSDYGSGLWNQGTEGNQGLSSASYNSMEEWAAETNNLRADPRASGSLNAAETKAADLRDLLNVDGRGVKVAVIDTGVDPGHPDLTRTPDGRLKVTDWVDLTDQGKIELTPAAVEGGLVKLPEDIIRLGGYSSRSGQVNYGFLDPARLPVKLETGGKKLLVLSLDTVRAGIYDTVLIDLNGNDRVDDEKPFAGYAASHQVGALVTREDRPFNFVVSNISPAGNYVKLGFDAVGHGTKVAGVLAANGLLQGVAPGAQVTAIKVFDSFTGNDADRLIEAIKLAGNMGVQVVNLSLGYSDLPADQRQELERVINDISATKGITFCISAGNLGPGLGSIASPAESRQGISVGGYLSPAMWRLNYGWQVAQPTLWYFSSVGPYAGGAAPVVVAPAAAVTATPQWNGGYSLEEGTSIAAPYAAGGAALLIQAARQEGVNVSPELLRLALARGADPLEGYSTIEAGYGALNLLRSWEILKEQPLPLLSSRQGAGYRGLYARSCLPGGSYLEMENPLGINQYLELSSDSSWIKLAQSGLQVPARGQRSVSLEYEAPDQPGLYTGLAVGKDPASGETRLEALQTVIVPYQLGRDSGMSVDDELAAGMYRRYFVKVPEGSGTLNLKVTIPKDEFGSYQGRVRMHLMDPGGKLIHGSGYAGSGYPASSAYEYLEFSQNDPAPGVWEIVAYSSVALSQYGLTGSRFTVAANLADWMGAARQAPQDKYLITSVPSAIKRGVQNLITLHFWDKVTKLPARGRVLINDLIYDIKNGKVAIDLPDQSPWLEIAW